MRARPRVPFLVSETESVYLCSIYCSIMLQWQRAAEARAGTDPDESTVMDRDIAIYQTVDADADSDGPGSDRGRAHTLSLQLSHSLWYGVKA